MLFLAERRTGPTPLEFFTNRVADRPVTMVMQGKGNLDRVEPPGMATLERAPCAG